MKSIKCPVFIICIFFSQSIFAQYFEFNWSDKIDYTNNKNGFFSGFINSSGMYIYALNSNYAVSPINSNKKLKIIAYNRTTLSEVASVALKGFPENKGTEKVYDSLNYFKTVVNEDRVMVFWTKLLNTDSTLTEELYVESFKFDLERDKTIKLIYSVTEIVDYKHSQFTPSKIIVIANEDASALMIGSEMILPSKKIGLKYMLIDGELKAQKLNTIDLGVNPLAEDKGLLCSYEMGIDQNIYIRSTMIPTREEQKQANNLSSFLRLTVINPISNNKIDLEMRDEKKTITDYSYLIMENKTKVIGFFGDLEKDPTGIDRQGIFYVEIDSETLKNTGLNYTFFEKTTLNKLVPKSRSKRKRPKKDEIRLYTEEELNTRFDIENIFLAEDSGVVVFFSQKYNYSEITSRSGMDGRNIYKTEDFCEKNNVSAMRITNVGLVKWVTTVARNITYEGTNISDVRVVNKANLFYMFCGSVDPKKISKKKRNNTVELVDKIEYTTFDATTGRAKVNELLLNEKSTLKKDLKTMNPQSIEVFDGNFYFNKMHVKQKPLWYVANVLCFPSIYYSVLSGNTKKATGDLGVIVLMSGKPSKKK